MPITDKLSSWIKGMGYTFAHTIKADSNQWDTFGSFYFRGDQEIIVNERTMPFLVKALEAQWTRGKVEEMFSCFKHE